MDAFNECPPVLSYQVYESIQRGFRRRRPGCLQVLPEYPSPCTEPRAMTRVDERSTSPTLLSEVSDWRNDRAWVSFHDRYDPLLRRWCRVRGLDEDSVDEVCQRIWI